MPLSWEGLLGLASCLSYVAEIDPRDLWKRMLSVSYEQSSQICKVCDMQDMTRDRLYCVLDLLFADMNRLRLKSASPALYGLGCVV